VKEKTCPARGGRERNGTSTSRGKPQKKEPSTKRGVLDGEAVQNNEEALSGPGSGQKKRKKKDPERKSPSVPQSRGLVSGSGLKRN